MNLKTGLILAAIWYVAVLTAVTVWYRRRPPPPTTGPLTAIDWVAAMPTHPATPPHGTPMERCQFRWQSPNLSPDVEADANHRCALYDIHADHHICPCGAQHSTSSSQSG